MSKPDDNFLQLASSVILAAQFTGDSNKRHIRAKSIRAVSCAHVLWDELERWKKEGLYESYRSRGILDEDV